MDSFSRLRLILVLGFAVVSRILFASLIVLDVSFFSLARLHVMS